LGREILMKADNSFFNDSFDLYYNNDGNLKCEYICDGPGRDHVRIDQLLNDPRLIAASLGGHISRENLVQTY
jgi:hypothetical protein